MNEYADAIIELSKHPISKQRLEHTSVTHTAKNPNCGDTITIDLLIENDIVTGIGWDGSGCAISQASMSLVCEIVLQKPVADILQLHIQNVLDTLGISIGPRRLACALLGLQGVQTALMTHRKI